MDTTPLLCIAARKDLVKLMAKLSATGVERLPSELELCDRLGVSMMTVKKVVRQLKSEGLIRSVHRRGNFIASAPRHHNLGLVMSDRGDAVFLRSPGVLAGILEVVQRNTCFLRILQLRQPAGASRLIARHGLDACLWYLPEDVCLPHMISAIRASGLPSMVVLSNWSQAAADVPCHVVPDPRQTTQRKVAFLISRGHRRIARFNVPAGDLEGVRNETFLAELAAGGAETRPEWALRREDAATRIPQLLDAGEVTAATVNGGTEVMRRVFEIMSAHRNVAGIELLVDDLGPEMAGLIAAYPRLRIAGINHSREVELGRRSAQAILDHLQRGTPLRSIDLEADIRAE